MGCSARVGIGRGPEAAVYVKGCPRRQHEEKTNNRKVRWLKAVSGMKKEKKSKVPYQPYDLWWGENSEARASRKY